MLHSPAIFDDRRALGSGHSQVDHGHPQDQHGQWGPVGPGGAAEIDVGISWRLWGCQLLAGYIFDYILDMARYGAFPK